MKIFNVKNSSFNISAIILSLLLSAYISFVINQLDKKNSLIILQPVYYNYLLSIEQYMNEVSPTDFSKFKQNIFINDENYMILYVLDHNNKVIHHENYTQLSFNLAQLLDTKQWYFTNPSNYSNFNYKQSSNDYIIFLKNIKISQQDFKILMIKDNQSIFHVEKQRFLFGFLFFFTILFVLFILIKKYFDYRSLKSNFTKQLNKEFSLFNDLIISNPQSLMVLTNSEGFIENVSENFQLLVLYNKNELSNKHISRLIPTFTNVETIFSILSKKDEEITLYCKNKYEKSALITLVPYYGLDDKIEKLLFIFNDLTEIKQKNEQLAKELTTTRTFSKITQLITNTSDPQLIVKTIIDETKELIDYDSGTLFLLDDQILRAYYSNNPEIADRIYTINLQIGQGLSGLVAKTQKGMIVNNALDSPIPSNVPNTNDTEECLISIPLISKTKLIGVATFSRFGNQFFKEEDLSILELLAAQVASVLDNSILLNQLAVSEKKYYTLINQSALSILILKERTITFCNKRFAEIIQVPQEKIINQDILQFISQKDKSVFASQLTSFLLENQCDDFEVRMVTAHRNNLIMSYSLSQISWENNQSIMVTATDITEKVELNKQLQQTQKLESVGALASGIAHDFKNILAGITGAADMILLREKEKTPIQNFARIIKTSADRGTKLSQRILGFTRKSEYEQQVFNLNDILNEIIEIATYTFEKNIEIKKSLSDKFLNFEGDPVKIQQCVLNLCVNARDAMQNGGLLTIESDIINPFELYQDRWKNVENSLYNRIIIRDTGSGIPLHVLSRIFEPFYTTKEKGKGTGLGLSTTKSIIDEYKGNLLVDSQENKGSTFTILLPWSESGVEDNYTPLTTITAHSQKIMLVDDEEFVLEVAKELLQELGNTVFTAVSGEEALKLFINHPDITLAIIDRMMPKMDGIQLYNKLKALNPKLKVVIASGFKDEQELSNLKAAGLFDYITKPYRLEDLNRILTSNQNN